MMARIISAYPLAASTTIRCHKAAAIRLLYTTGEAQPGKDVQKLLAVAVPAMLIVLIVLAAHAALAASLLASDKVFGLLRDPTILFVGDLGHLVRLF